MKIWLDGDACPKQIRAILCRAAIRTTTELVIVSNHFFTLPASPFIIKKQVPQGFDSADNYIVDNVASGDLIITTDIPLADTVISKGGTVITHRGELYTAQNIKQKLAYRDINEQLRGSGLMIGGPQKLSPKEIQNFSNYLDRFLAHHKN